MEGGGERKRVESGEDLREEGGTETSRGKEIVEGAFWRADLWDVEGIHARLAESKRDSRDFCPPEIEERF